MNETLNNFLLAEYNFMSQMHLRQPGFRYSVCEPLNINKEGRNKFKVT